MEETIRGKAKLFEDWGRGLLLKIGESILVRTHSPKHAGGREVKPSNTSRE